MLPWSSVDSFYGLHFSIKPPQPGGSVSLEEAVKRNKECGTGITHTVHMMCVSH